MRYIVRSSEKYSFRGFYYFPVIGYYEDTKGREVHFSAHLHIYEKKIPIIMRCTFHRAQLLLLCVKITKIIGRRKSTQLLLLMMVLVISRQNNEVHFGITFRRIPQIHQKSNYSPTLHKSIFRAELKTAPVSNFS